MSSRGSDVIHNISENLLSCDVCKESFNTSSRKPRTLRCTHAFCDVCLRRLIQNRQVKCPVCRKVTPVEGELPVDHTRMTLLDMVKSTSRGSSNGARAHSRSQESSDANHRSGRARNQGAPTLAEVEEFFRTIQKCSRHTDMKLDRYCKTCKKCVCSKCARFEHRDGHRVVEAATLIRERKEMTTLCEELEQLAPRVHSGLERAQSRLEREDTSWRTPAYQRNNTARDATETNWQRGGFSRGGESCACCRGDDPEGEPVTWGRRPGRRESVADSIQVLGRRPEPERPSFVSLADAPSFGIGGSSFAAALGAPSIGIRSPTFVALSDTPSIGIGGSSFAAALGAPSIGITRRTFIAPQCVPSIGMGGPPLAAALGAPTIGIGGSSLAAALGSPSIVRVEGPFSGLGMLPSFSSGSMMFDDGC